MSSFHLDDINWQPNIEGVYNSEQRFNLNDYFTSEKVPGDGNCFFYSVSFLLFESLSEWRSIKNTIASFAAANWGQCVQAKLNYANSSDYRADMLRNYYWGGSVEAEILSKALNITIILWEADVSENVVTATKYGPGLVSTALNLKLCQGHIEPLQLMKLVDQDVLRKSGSHHHHHH
uniref:RNA-dependent RNA polymerase n=1 Tax=Orthonairovirus khani TaxID=3052525 RepID=UPI000F7351B2|nr:Chain A, RNA-dependent RNA polymerase [Orthonairovirus khani]6DX2_B Chain B, RNA-dependent RNA polymerase [Orthonairovirus khani]